MSVRTAGICHTRPLRRGCRSLPTSQMGQLRLPEALDLPRVSRPVAGWTERLTLPGPSNRHKVELLGQPPLLVLHGSWGRHTVPSP